MKKLWIVSLLVAFMVVLTACSPIKEGVVTEKHHEDASRTLIFVPIKIGNATVLQQYWIIDDEDWAITIEKDGVSAYIYVEKDAWDKIEVGENVSFETPQTKDDVVKEKKTEGSDK